MLSLTTAALPIVHLQRSRLRRCLSTMSRNMASVTAHVFVLWTVTIIRHLLQTATSTSSDSSTLLSLALTTCAASIYLDWLYYRQSATIGCSCSLLTCSTIAVTYLLAKDTYMYNDSTVGYTAYTAICLILCVLLSACVQQSASLVITIPCPILMFNCHVIGQPVFYHIFDFSVFSRLDQLYLIVNCTASILLLFLVQQVGPRAF